MIPQTATLEESFAAALTAPPEGLERAEPDETDPVEIGDPPRWVIDTDTKAAWALRKLAAARAEVARATALRDAEIARINAWYTEATAPAEKDARNFEGMLYRYAVSLYAADPTRRTWSFPAGKISLTVTQTVKPLGDEGDELVAWAESNGYGDTLVKVVKTPRIADLRKLLKTDENGRLLRVLDTGEPCPAIEIGTNEKWKYTPTEVTV